LSKFQLIAAVGAILLVCGLISSIMATIVLDQLSDGDDDSQTDAVVNSSELRDELRRAAESNPDNAMSQAAYANYLANTGDITTAIPFYERAIALDPANWTIRLDFAQSLSSNNLLADAELQLDRILELDRENAQGWYYLAELYQKFDPPRTDEAIYAYQQVIRFDPTSFIASQSAVALTALGAGTPSASTVASPEAIP
jgi:tetratricopeptide (TPR) repeat protein